MSLVVALTGHRPDKLGGYQLENPLNQFIYHKLTTLITQLAAVNGGLTGLSGMALGADTLWAKALLSAREAGQPVRLSAYVPCRTQPNRWHQSNRDLYYQLLDQADTRKYFAETYNFKCMQKRNRHLVDDCDLLIAVYDGSHGGTYNTVQYAKHTRPNLPIVYLNPQFLAAELSSSQKVDSVNETL